HIRCYAGNTNPVCDSHCYAGYCPRCAEQSTILERHNRRYRPGIGNFYTFCLVTAYFRKTHLSVAFVTGQRRAPTIMERQPEVVDLFIDINFYNCIYPFTAEWVGTNVVFYLRFRLHIRSSVWRSKGIHVFNQAIFSKKMAIPMAAGTI